jgi:hypothetical protein
MDDEKIRNKNRNLQDENLSSDNVGHVPTLTDTDGLSRTMSDNVAQAKTSDNNEVWLTTDEIVQRLSEKFTVKRDRRSAERYCNSGKVKAFLDDAQGIWFAEQSSVDILGAQLLEIHNRKYQGGQGTVSKTEQDKSNQDNNDAENSNQNAVERKGKQISIHDLRAQVMQLEFEVKSKTEIINHLQSAREKDRDRFIELASESGEYKAETKHLRATLQLTDGGVQESIITSENNELESVLSQSLPLSENDSISDVTHQN